jgi:hypothetical protein
VPAEARISRLPEVTATSLRRSSSSPIPFGYFHLDIAEVSTEEGKLRLLVAIDRTSKFAFVRLVGSAERWRQLSSCVT